MATNTVEDLYDLVLQLPVSERLRLIEMIAHDLAVELAGPAPGPTRGPLPTLPRDLWESALGSSALGAADDD